MILQRASDDFRGGSRSAVNQNHNGLAARDIAGLCGRALDIGWVAALGDDDNAAFEEGIGNGDGLIEQPAWIIAQIDDIARERRPGDFLNVLNRRLQIVGGVLVLETLDLDPANIAFDAVLHRIDPDDLAHDFHGDRMHGTLPVDGERYGRARGPAHAVDRLIHAQALDRLAVEFGDGVTRDHACPLGRHVVDGRDHFQNAVLHRDVDAKAAEFAMRLDLLLLELLGAHIARMGIELHQHAVDCLGDELSVVGLFNVLLADVLEHLTEQFEILVNLRAGRDGAVLSGGIMYENSASAGSD